MSHTPGGDVEEPNFTPLLDVVLQLVMFFMMCANFVMDEVKNDIVLPLAQSAKPMDRLDKAPLFVNIDDQDRIWMVGRPDALSNMGVFDSYLRDEKRDRTPPGKTEPNSIIVIRADQNTTYEKVYDVISRCKSAGFTDLQMRAIVKKS